MTLEQAIQDFNEAREKPPWWEGQEALIAVDLVRPTQAGFEHTMFEGKPEFVGRIRRSDGKVGIFKFTHGGGRPFELPAAAVSFAKWWRWGTGRLKKREIPGVCLVFRCINEHHMAGFCQWHYARWADYRT